MPVGCQGCQRVLRDHDAFAVPTEQWKGEHTENACDGSNKEQITFLSSSPLPFHLHLGLTELASVSRIVSHCIVSVAVRVEHGVFNAVHQIKHQLLES